MLPGAYREAGTALRPERCTPNDAITRQRHVDVRPGDQRSIDDQFHVGLGIRAGQQQPAEELARYVAGDGSPAAAQTSAANDDRRTAAGRFADRVGAELPQGVGASPRWAAGAFAACRRADRCHGPGRAWPSESAAWFRCWPRRGRLASAGSRPAQPTTRIVAAAGSCSTAMPSRPSDSIITRVSSLSSAPANSDSPSANAAQTSARLVMLFEPGGRMVPCSGPVGWISMESVTASPCWIVS